MSDSNETVDIDEKIAELMPVLPPSKKGRSKLCVANRLRSFTIYALSGRLHIYTFTFHHFANIAFFFKLGAFIKETGQKNFVSKNSKFSGNSLLSVDYVTSIHGHLIDVTVKQIQEEWERCAALLVPIPIHFSIQFNSAASQHKMHFVLSSFCVDAIMIVSDLSECITSTVISKAIAF